MRWARAFGLQLFGTPPGPNSSREERLLYLRRYYLRPLPFTLLVCVFAVVVVSSTFGYIAVGLSALLWLQGFATLTLQIRRERKRPT
jgi:hypothetical protein